MKLQKKPKLRKGVWFYKVRGSYLPATWQGWLLYIPLTLGTVLIIIDALNDDRNITRALLSFCLAMVSWGAIFTWIAARKV